MKIMTDKEIQVLKENFPKYGAKYCANKLGYNNAKIYRMAYKLGLKVNKIVVENNPTINLAGQRFGKLTVLNNPPILKRSGNLNWKCKCDCGKIIIICETTIKSGRKRPKSCGCMVKNYKHGLSQGGKMASNYIMWRSAKIRAKRANRTFTIMPNDIVIPDKCPLLDIPISTTNHKTQDNCASLDRIDNSRGYDPKNVWVISYKANRTKNNLSLAELKMLVERYEQKLVEQKIHENRKS
jgi:hypothetical protein